MTSKDVSQEEVLVRPDDNAGWRVELTEPERPGGVFVMVVADKAEALALAARMRPEARVRVVTDGPSGQ